MEIFKKGDTVYFKEAECEFISYGDLGNHSLCTVKTSKGTSQVPPSMLSFTPYTITGFTQERPKPKPAGIFWDDDKSNACYGILIKEHGTYVSEDGAIWKNFEEMTFDEYRKLKGL